MADETKRVIDQTTDSSLSAGDYVIVDSESEGTRKFDLGTELTDIKQDLQDLQEEIESGGSGLTADIKAALDQLAQKVAYIDEDGQDYYDALHAALYPPVNLTSISCVYTQSGTVYDTDSLDSLKSDLVVTAHYSNGTSETVTNYTLSGTLAEGTSTVTVSYGGKTTTFTVTVTHSTLLYQLPQATTFDGSDYIDTEVAPFTTDRDFTIAFDFEWASDAPALTCVFRCGEPRFVLQAKAANTWKFYFRETAAWGSNIASGTRTKCVAKHSQGGGFDLYIQTQGETLASSTQSWNLLTTENTLYIGANQGNGSSYNFRGTIYDFKIDSRVWDSDEVNAYLTFSE